MDLTGKTFGKLKVLEKTSKRYRYNYFYLCQCECGKKILVLDKSLTSGNTKSCGCLQKEKASEIGTKNIESNSNGILTLNKNYNTNISSITNNKPKNNTTGIKGVYFNKARNKYEAYIQIHNKRFFLGRFDNKNDAIFAREEAEEKYFQPIIKLYNSNKGRL